MRQRGASTNKLGEVEQIEDVIDDGSASALPVLEVGEVGGSVFVFGDKFAVEDGFAETQLLEVEDDMGKLEVWSSPPLEWRRTVGLSITAMARSMGSMKRGRDFGLLETYRTISLLG